MQVTDVCLCACVCVRELVGDKLGGVIASGRWNRLRRARTSMTGVRAVERVLWRSCEQGAPSTTWCVSARAYKSPSLLCVVTRESSSSSWRKTEKAVGAVGCLCASKSFVFILLPFFLVSGDRR